MPGMPDEEPTWGTRAREEFAVRYTAPSWTLMRRFADEKGLDSSGRMAEWTDIAHFTDGVMAKRVAETLQSKPPS